MKALALFVIAALPAVASAEIFRCQSRNSAVTYQEVPCDDDALGGRASIPSEFPPVNTEARDRLFAREAAMYKRLEAQRDRQMQEAVLRDAREERAIERQQLAAAAAAAAAPQFFVAGRPSRAWRGIHRSSVR